MKVFGIGLNKTGTTTLGKALEILGYTKHQRANLGLLKNWKNGNFDPIYAVAEENECFEDWPWPLLYKEMYEKFPNAKFVLTSRINPEKWFQSLCKHADRVGPTEFRKIAYGHVMPHNFKSEHIEIYNKHMAEVTGFFKSAPKGTFVHLCWENGHGWKELCDFLERPIPSIDFPVLNKSKK